MIFLLKYWKLLLGLVMAVGLGAVILVLHMELSSTQHQLARCTAKSAILNDTIMQQNAAIQKFHVEQLLLARRVSKAEQSARRVHVMTVTKIEQVQATPVGKTCEDAMNFLRAEALRAEAHQP